ncbi:atp-dependent dna helicase uvrd/pcra, actinomycete [hydrocarbon metagenome]|uniref:DNA 3'-5' helicase n=1 Tax=hydrocarbon metagenome TaxID=938273 RepID=A0A0W8FEI3_9ZZZZ
MQEILAAWQEFKTAGGYLEHEDYVSMAVTEELPPPAAILVVDEYQDTSPAQDALIRSWSTNAETVYIAGDPDQSIYGFRGCDPALLQDFPNVIDRGARNGERPISHRCPASVMAAAETILGRPSNAAPAPRIGSSTHAIITKTADLVWWVETALRYAQERDRDRIFVLTRFRRHVRALANDLAAAGIPCASINPKRIRLWSDVKTRDQSTVNAWQLTQAVRRVSTGKFYDPIPISEASALIAAIMPANARTAILADLKKAASLKIGDVLRWTGENPFRYRTFPQLDRRVTERIYAALDREKVRGHIIVPDQVQIDTIHAAKGLEASVVLLHSAYLRGRMDDLQDARRLAEERRVYFVGATRAEHALVTFDYGSAVKNPLIAGGAAFWQGATA